MLLWILVCSSLHVVIVSVPVNFKAVSSHEVSVLMPSMFVFSDVLQQKYWKDLMYKGLVVLLIPWEDMVISQNQLSNTTPCTSLTRLCALEFALHMMSLLRSVKILRRWPLVMYLLSNSCRWLCRHICSRFCPSQNLILYYFADIVANLRFLHVITSFLLHRAF